MASIADHHGPVRRGIERVGQFVRAAGTAFVGLPLWRALADLYRRSARALGRAMPKGLFARSLIIIIAPIVLLQAVIAFVFLERHYSLVTENLAAATTRDIAALIELLEAFPAGDDTEELIRVAGEEQNLIVALLPGATLPPGTAQPFFSLLDRALSQQITETIGLPFWIDTVGRSSLIEIRIELEGRVLQILAQRSGAYAVSSEVFIFWMIGTSLVLVTIAILFLRNQIRPIQRLADAAERFGRGRPAPEFTPRGAREVRRASAAFIRMRERIIRQMEQRTEMLAGVSHDLRTILTRFRLQLELMGEAEGSEELRQDIADMQQMLEDYLAFASGDSAERNEPTDVAALLEREAQHVDPDKEVSITYAGERIFALRPRAYRRCIGNLVSNAARYADRIAIAGSNATGWLTVTIDDDGAGIPVDQRENVFKPFHRLDAARNIEESGTGLGLPIARDIARSHGGDITLSDSPLGGLRATVMIPA
jgi:two-component system osmolarity sensor histidine kinase EnvZ